jgi:divalent metal cation (Fe/Co/Zn/Cd) transporter
MNIRLKAALEVTGFIASAIIIGAVARITLNYLSNIYGSEQVVNALVCIFVGTAAYVAVSLLYDIRVSQLKYKEKLTEMVKK